MRLEFTKYRTLTGIKEVAEIPEKKLGEFIVYQGNEPAFYVDCFDFTNESNQIFNGLLLAGGKSIAEVLTQINKKNKTNLRVQTAPIIEIEVGKEFKEIALRSFPLEWLN